MGERHVSDQLFDKLLLENQLCFPLYACAREVIKRYKPFLDEIDLTYTQYITMMVLWERRELTARELGTKLFLDSGTLTPLLKKLERKGLITRQRSHEDERNLIVSITEEGLRLREAAQDIPGKISSCVALTSDEMNALYQLLYKILHAGEIATD